MTKKAQVIYLKDYQVPDFIIETTDLDIRIDEEYTSVVARLKVFRNPKSNNKSSDLLLQGGSDIKLQEVIVNGLVLSSADYLVQEDSLTLSLDADIHRHPVCVSPFRLLPCPGPTKPLPAFLGCTPSGHGN